jgi:23S rRNA (cytidine1920-2'-O)/16S rRNA (cytidine1409-2'-O)-methyltransferase
VKERSERARKQRVDALLMERGLAESRAKAQALVLAGQVWSGNRRLDKPGSLISSEEEIRIEGEPLRYVSRGGLKLEKALDHFQISVSGKICADIGASTGGFTDCLLQRGATRVYAIDVGRGQLHEKLRRDPRVIARERINARSLSERELPEQVDLIVADVSFISLKKVLPPALARLKAGGMLVALVKPQFEVGRAHVGKGGVVRDPKARADAIEGIARYVAEQGLEVLGVVDSPIAGPAGNLEALLTARRREC